MSYFKPWKKITSNPDWYTLKNYLSDQWRNKIPSWQRTTEDIQEYQTNLTKGTENYSTKRQQWSQFQEQQKENIKQGKHLKREKVGNQQ